MSELDGATLSQPARAPRSWWIERADPWWSDAFAAGGATLAGVGLLVLGLDLSQDWATTLIGIYVAVAYLVEPFLPRAARAACTTVVALGTPTFVALVVFPVHTYNGFRMFEIATIALWFAFFAIGGTRGRIVLLALAVTFTWVFVTLEVGHVQQSVKYLDPFRVGALVTPSVGNSSQCAFDSTENVTCSNNGVQETLGDAGSPTGGHKSPADYSLGIGLESLAFGLAFLFGVRYGERNNRRGLATAFVVPAALSLLVAVSALGDKSAHVWIGGVLALLAGLVIGAIANGRRRFLTWLGAIGSVIGVALIAGDIANSIWGGEHDQFRYTGLTFFVFGLATMFAAVAMTRVLGESPATPDP
ncbi:MAG TPA: hypothetical protein VGO03_19325 [Acidimicrobiia bacterium]|jgi:hypothetical protein